MNIYSKKQQWKLWLAIAATLIVVISLYFSNVLVNKIRQEERNKVALWADAIERKAKLVNYTSELFKTIASEERKRIEIWAEANKRIASSNIPEDLSFYLDIISSNTTIPVVVVDDKGIITNSRNLPPEIENDSTKLYEALEKMKATNPPIEITVYGKKKNYLYYSDSKIFSQIKIVLDDLIGSFISEIVINSASVPVIITDSTQQHILEYGNLEIDSLADKEALLMEQLQTMKSQNKPIKVVLDENKVNYIFYKDSKLLTQLQYFPIFQFIVIGLFLIIAYYLFSTARKSEQNQVWVGMAKETAHQLGTPLSSLIAWVEYLKTKDIDSKLIDELTKDIDRLEMITERFSKIGSVPKLEQTSVYEIIEKTVNYLKSRISGNVTIDIHAPKNGETTALINASLFSWVLENLIKNAVDAMEGKGAINIHIIDQVQYVYIDISDTGKGISKKNFKTIFEPGYTTKQRGWGLGLSLVKRIIENYHSGKIFVKNSSPHGTTFRIVLKK